MDREQKAAAVAELSQELKGAETIFAVDYRGISVTQAAELRRRLAEADAAFKVVKNRLAKLSVADAGTEGIDEFLIGPTALTLVNGDAVVAAKAISTFTREHSVLEFKGGIMDGEPLDPDTFQAIARLPGLEVLHGQLVGVTASPLTGLVRGLASMVSGLALALGQIAEQGLVSGEAPGAEQEGEPDEPPVDETPADETPADEPPADDATPADETPADEPPADDAAPADETPAEAEPAEASAAAETSEAPEASDESDDKQAESSEEAEPEGEGSEDSDSTETPEEA